MAINWGDCIPKETILVKENGERELFLMQHKTFIFVEPLDEDTVQDALVQDYSRYVDSHIEGDGIATDLLIAGESVLRDSTGRLWVYLMHCGTELFVRSQFPIERLEPCEIRSVLKETYQTWTVVKYA